MDQEAGNFENATQSLAPGEAPPSARDNETPKNEYLSPLPAPLPRKRVDYDEPTLPQTVEPRLPFSDQPLPRMPQSRNAGGHGLFLSFLALFIIPTIVVALYYSFYAGDQYQSEFRFSVAQGNAVLPGTTAGAIGSGSSSVTSNLASMLGGSAPGGASQQNFVVIDYIQSRQAVDDLKKSVDIKTLFSRQDIPWMERFDAKRSDDTLAKYLKRYISAYYDQVTGLAYVSVRAYTAADANRISTALYKLSDKLINDINLRANADAITSAEAEDQKTETKLDAINDKLTSFRTKSGTVNPSNGIVAINVSLAQALQSNLISLQTHLSSAKSQGLSLRSPAMQDMTAQVNAAKAQLTDLDNKIARTSGQTQSLARVQGDYDQLIFEQAFAQTMASQTRQALLLARAYAATQHLYIEPYVMPTLPQVSDYPNRSMSTLLYGFLFLGFWFAAVMIYKAIDDHRG